MALLLVLMVALVVLGPKRLPDAGGALGSGIRNLKRGLIEEPRSEEGTRVPPR